MGTISAERKDHCPQNSKIWIESKHQASELKVPVIYYLSRNGQLEHPHLMEVPISSPHRMLSLKGKCYNTMTHNIKENRDIISLFFLNNFLFYFLIRCDK